MHGGLSQSCAASAADEVMLIQAATLRHPEPPAHATKLLDTDGCPASDPHLAYNGNCTSGVVQAVRERLCTPAKHDEKEVYFLRHAEPECCQDCGLNDNGIAQCEGLKANNKLLKDGPLSSSKRVQVVYTSPATRAMETAFRVFSDAGTEFRIDRLLAEAHPFSHNFSEGERVINTMNRTELLEPYRRLFGEDSEGHSEWMMGEEPWKQWDLEPEKRAANFTRYLLKQKEKRIAVVTHFFMLGKWNPTELGMKCMEMGQVVVKAAVSKTGAWRLISEASCQGRRRRWPWGNYNRQVQAELGDGV